MAIKKIRMRPEGTNDYGDTLHPETSASVVLEEENKRFMTDAERTKLSGIEVGANAYVHDATHPASMITGLPTSLPANGGNSSTVGGKTIWVGAEASKGTNANTIYFCY